MARANGECLALERSAERSEPRGDGREPGGLAVFDDCREMVGVASGVLIHRSRVVEYQCKVSAMGGDWQVIEAALVTAANICFGHIVPTKLNPRGDTREVDFHVGCANVDEIDVKAEIPRINHSLQIHLPGECRLNGECASAIQVFLNALKDLTTGGEWILVPIVRLDHICKRIGIKKRKRRENVQIARSKRTLPRPIRAGNERERRWLQ